jgi:hypothetical protein
LPKPQALSPKCANSFVPLQYQPENNDSPVQTPPTGFTNSSPVRGDIFVERDNIKESQAL